MQEWPAVGLYNVHAAATTLTSFTRRQSFSVPSLHCNALSFPLTKPFSFGSFLGPLRIFEYLRCHPSVRLSTHKKNQDHLFVFVDSGCHESKGISACAFVFVCVFVCVFVIVSVMAEICVCHQIS